MHSNVRQSALPFIFPAIEITEDDKIIQNGKELSINEFNGITEANVTDILVLKAIAFQKFFWPVKLWQHLDVITKLKDGTTPESLVLKPKYPVEHPAIKGFYMIPYYSNYAISEDSTVIKLSEGRECQQSLCLHGYVSVRVTNDNKRTSNMRLHRLTCLAFKEYTVDPSELSVNHIDHNVANNHVNNLEWCTSLENSHAYINNLMEWMDGREIQVYDQANGHTYIFASVQDAEKQLDMSCTWLIKLAKTNGRFHIGGYQVRPHPSTEPWPKENVLQLGRMNKGKRKDAAYLVIKPDGTKLKAGGRLTSRIAGISRTSLVRSIREGRNKTANGTIFMLNTEENLEKYKNLPWSST